MPATKTFYRRKLPHWHPAGATFFITFRLANSLPPHILEALRAEREAELAALDRQLPDWRARQYALEKRYFGHFDAWLDQVLEDSPRWLAQPTVARIVADEIRRLDGERYRLLAYCIMPNHVHLLIETPEAGRVAASNRRGATRQYPLSDTLRLLKGRTARFCNRQLGRTGKFWQHESYDHVVRDAAELQRIVEYIALNPVRAGLVSCWEDWPYTFISQQ